MALPTDPTPAPAVETEHTGQARALHQPPRGLGETDLPRKVRRRIGLDPSIDGAGPEIFVERVVAVGGELSSGERERIAVGPVERVCHRAEEIRVVERVVREGGRALGYEPGRGDQEVVILSRAGEIVRHDERIDTRVSIGLEAMARDRVFDRRIREELDVLYGPVGIRVDLR